MKYYSQEKYTIITNTFQVIAALILAAPLMWEGIDDVNTSFSIEYGRLWTTITREIFKILIYFLLQNMIILDGLSFSNVYPKINFDLTWPLINRVLQFLCKRKYIKILNISLVIVVQRLPYCIEKDVLTSSIPSHLKGTARI